MWSGLLHRTLITFALRVSIWTNTNLQSPCHPAAWTQAVHHLSVRCLAPNWLQHHVKGSLITKRPFKRWIITFTTSTILPKSPGAVGHAHLVPFSSLAVTNAVFHSVFEATRRLFVMFSQLSHQTSLTLDRVPTILPFPANIYYTSINREQVASLDRHDLHFTLRHV